MRIVWTPLGLKSLKSAVDFIEMLWNEEVAEDFIDRLDERIGQLEKNPRIGPIYKTTKFRQLHIHPSVTLYYELKSKYISLILVWANKKDPNELMEELDRI